MFTGVLFSFFVKVISINSVYIFIYCMVKKDTWSQWISLSDMMTWLMLIFLLISVLVISEVKEYEQSVRKQEYELIMKKAEVEKSKKDLEEAREELAKKELIIQLNEKYRDRVLLEYSNVKDELYKDLQKAFVEKQQEWEMTISDDMTIKFDNPEIFFQANSDTISDAFQNILDDFIPKYLAIVNDERYVGKIKEIRVEGHAWKCLESEYMYCLELSQNRSNSVLEYIFKSPTFLALDQNQKEKMKFVLTSNGMSDGKNLDIDWKYTYYSHKQTDSESSRRVEFRIVTNSEQLVEDLINKTE